MRKISFLASERHFIDHLLPIWTNLSSEIKDKFFVSQEAKDYSEFKGINSTVYRMDVHNDNMKRKNTICVVASWGDLKKLNKGNVKIIYLEHGAGQFYDGRYISYAGGKNRENVIMFLCPNVLVEKKNKEYYPKIPTRVVGCPKLDEFHKKTYEINKTNPMVGISFHWNCRICPETLSAFDHYKNHITNIKYELLGHSHPRDWTFYKKFYRKNNINRTQFFTQVLDNADVYCVDNSSTLFEFASLNKPVVVLNAPWYRREIEHGLRFWEFSDIGINCENPQNLNACIESALNMSDSQNKRQKEIIDILYPNRKKATKKSIEAIMEVI